MRIRSKTNMVELQSNGSYVNSGCTTGNNGTFPSVGSGISVGTSKRIVDVVTSQYGKKRARGDVIINPLSIVETTKLNSFNGYVFTSTCQSPKPNYVLTIVGPSLSIGNGNPDPGFLITNDEIDGLIARASTACWADVNQAEAQVLVSLLEVRRSISMLISPLSNVQRFLSKVRSDAFSKLGSAARGLTLAEYIAREWLTYRYGWSQLYRDVRAVAKAIGRKEKRGLQTGRGKASTSKESNFNSQTGGTVSLPEKYFYNNHITDSVSVSCGIYYDAIVNVENYLGLSKYNLLETAWEVIPYSFVVDWVVNVQTYLNALLPAALVPVKGSYTTVNRIRTASRTFTGLDLTPRNIPPHIIWSAVAEPSGMAFTSIRSKERRLGIAPPTLSTDIRIKDFLDIRVLDSLALVTNRLMSRMK